MGRRMEKRTFCARQRGALFGQDAEEPWMGEYYIARTNRGTVAATELYAQYTMMGVVLALLSLVEAHTNSA
jgi:hypothetical protein